MLKSKLKKILPKQFLMFYHWALAYLSAFIYKWPSQKMIVIGVTGTAGKSTVVNIISKILEQAEFKTGFATTFNFKIGNKEWRNNQKMTMLGRFALQKLLKKMVDDNCEYAIIETTSEGIKQYRHLGINYDFVVFTNLAKEHIESHGSFEKYRQAKQKLFKHITKNKIKKINNKKIAKTIIVNLDDKYSDYFLKFNVNKKYGYSLKRAKDKNISISQSDLIGQSNQQIKILTASNLIASKNGTEFSINNINFRINLLGEFNVYNVLSATCVGLGCGIDLKTCQQAVAKINKVAGRMEIVNKNPLIIVDYAHTPDSLEKVYKSIKNNFDNKLICVFGSAGGGRDKWKRPVLANIAEKYCDHLIVTNEDPYDEDPEQIIDEIISGISKQKVVKIIDREEAINKAINLAQPEDIIVITGKGSESLIMGAKGEKVQWDDREVVRKLLVKK
ncbi:UDP-N-acetylmuramoyl-L-alanyl-D-glutamate--2,6-diaminopimelate ligase [Patescibacteria group bacterium]|nr:UDP-N-acetylmuramoyl-L-alanyl-D-glutamate--2,6-diaminopimelate ligase [Patescibacteria group bacterium]